MDKYEKAQETAWEANAMIPEPESWGVEFFTEGPMGMGGGAFLWFGTRDELLEYVGGYLTYFPTGPSHEGHEEAAHQVAAVVAKVVAGELGMDEALEPINSALLNVCQLSWWGQFEELIEGTGSFAREVRAWSRSLADDDLEDSSPISDEELDEFKHSLTEWGM